MMAMRAFVVGIIILAASNGYCESATDKILMSRDLAVVMALRKNLDLRIEALNSSMSAIDLARSWGIYDTNLNASVSGAESTTSGDASFTSRNTSSFLGVERFVSTGGSIAIATQTTTSSSESETNGAAATEWQSSVGVTVSQPLLKSAGKQTTEINITLAAGALQDSIDRFRLVATDTVSAVITSYNHLYVLRKVLESRVTALSSAQKFLDEIMAKQPGPLQKLEIANAEFAVTRRRRDLVEAERNVSDHQANFRYLIGLETNMQVFPVDPPSREEPPETHEEAVKAALDSRPDLIQLRRALELSRLQERVARRQSLPDLLAFASGGVNGTGGSFGDSYQQIGEAAGTFWSAGVELNIPLGNTFAENDYRKRQVLTEQLQNQIQALSWLIRNDVDADMRALISARLQIQTADASAQFAERRLEEYRKSNAEGAATVQNVIDAENDLTTAHNTQLDALETFANGVTKLWRDTGELLDRQRVSIDISHPEKLVRGDGGSGK